MNNHVQSAFPLVRMVDIGHTSALRLSGFCPGIEDRYSAECDACTCGSRTWGLRDRPVAGSSSRWGEVRACCWLPVVSGSS